MMMRRFGGSFQTLPLYHKLNHQRCCGSGGGRAVGRGGGIVMVASSHICSSSIVVVSTLPSLLLDQMGLPLRPRNHFRGIDGHGRLDLPWTRGIDLAKHRGNFSTLARVEDNSTTTAASSSNNNETVAHDNDDEEDREEEEEDEDENFDEENGDLDEDVNEVEDDVDDSNDEDGKADNDAIHSNRNNYDEYFSNINVDDITSLELPPNPDIPPPKVRNWSPIAPTPTTNKQNQKSRNSQRAAALNVLANDRLVTQIMANLKQRHQKGGTTSPSNGHQRNNMSADDIQVRVVPDPLLVKLQKAIEQESTTTTTTTTNPLPPQHKPMVMTLSEAIKMSIEQEKDLVEVSIDQEVPVVTISNMKGMAYQSAKSKKTSKGTNAASSQVKEVTMQAGIAANDLQRKVNDIFKFLEKGHMCTVSIRINRRQSRTNANAPEDAIQRILPLFTAVEDPVEMVVPPEVNPLRTMVSFRVRAATKKK